MLLGLVAGLVIGALVAVRMRRPRAAPPAQEPSLDPDALLAYARAVAALPRAEDAAGAVVAGVRDVLGGRAEIGRDGPDAVRLEDGTVVGASWPVGDGGGGDRAGLAALAALADIGAVAARARAENADVGRRRAALERLEDALAQTEDVFGASHAALRALADETGATSLVVEATGPTPVTVVRDREGEDAHRRVVVLAAGGRCEIGWPAPPDAGAARLADALAGVLGRHLALVAARERAKARGLRLAAAAAVASSIAREASASADDLVEASRDAVGADAAVLYAAAGRDLLAVAAHGCAVPETADGAALQAFAGRRTALDDTGALLGPGALEGFASAVSVPVPGSAGAPAGALTAAFRASRPASDDAADDLQLLAALAGLALERRQLDRELARHRRVRSGLLEVTDMLSASPADAHRAIAASGRRALQADRALLATARGALLAGAGPGAETLRPPQLAVVAARDRRPVLCADVASDRRIPADERARLDQDGVRSLLCVPVGRAEGGAAVAVLCALWSEPREAGDDELELARHVATAADAAIERAETITAERQQRQRAQELQRIGGLIARSLDDASVLREIVAQAANLLAADACALNLVEGDRIRVSAVQGAEAERLAGTSVGVESTHPSAVVARRRRAIALRDLSEAGQEGRVEDMGALVSFLGVPVISAAGSVRGVLAVYGTQPRTWGSDEIGALEAFATSAAVALENAELFGRAATEKERSEAVVASIADGIVAVDARGIVEAWNPAAAAITGIASDDVLGRRLDEVAAAELGATGADLAAALAQAAETHGSADARIARGAREIWVTVRAAQLRAPGRDEPSVVYALRDVTEDRQLDQLKSDFVATVSHELRTPLTSIYGFAETLLRDDVAFAADDRATFLRFIATESQRLTRLVDGLLSVARLEAGALGLDLDEVDVCAILSDVAVTEGRRVATSHTLTVDLPEEPLVVTADRDRLRQVIINLVDNAIKYSPDGGDVVVSATRGPNGVEVRVGDEGIGISEADQRNLFRKFFRADARMTRGIRGIGLGLYLTRGFVTAMGGRIRVESAEGVGSTFIVELPARTPERRLTESGVA